MREKSQELGVRGQTLSTLSQKQTRKGITQSRGNDPNGEIEENQEILFLCDNGQKKLKKSVSQIQCWPSQGCYRSGEQGMTTENYLEVWEQSLGSTGLWWAVLVLCCPVLPPHSVFSCASVEELDALKEPAFHLLGVPGTLLSNSLHNPIKMDGLFRNA